MGITREGLNELQQHSHDINSNENNPLKMNEGIVGIQLHVASEKKDGFTRLTFAEKIHEVNGTLPHFAFCLCSNL